MPKGKKKNPYYKCRECQAGVPYYRILCLECENMANRKKDQDKVEND